jgi:hypothetical protein
MGILASQLRYDPISLGTSPGEYPRSLQQLRDCSGLSRHAFWRGCRAVARFHGVSTPRQECATKQSQDADFTTHRYCYIITGLWEPES